MAQNLKDHPQGDACSNETLRGNTKSSSESPPSQAPLQGEHAVRGAKPSRPQAPNRPELPPLDRSDERLKRPISKEALPFARKRSGGPQSAEGRARASLNAIKHGGYVTAKSTALDFHATLSELISRVNPNGAIEEGVVNSLACELFRLSMLSKLELERVQTAVNAEVSTLSLGRALDYPWLMTHPDELRNPPALEVLQARLKQFFLSQLCALQSQCTNTPSVTELSTIEALEQAISDLRVAEESTAETSEQSGDEQPSQPAYFDELDRHMRILACGNELLGHRIAAPADPQPLVDYWLFRNRHRIEVTRRELQVEQMVLVLTDEGVRRARGHAMRQIDDCVKLLEMLRSGPVDFGSAWRVRLGK